MRDRFPGWVPPDEKTLSDYWNEATFAIDTSVLLDLYRFSEETREGLLRALRSFGDRLWTPHQVALEFHRNRFSVLLAQREAEKNLLDGLEQLQSDLDNQLSQRLRGLGRRDVAPIRKAVSASFEDLRQKLQAAEKAHTKGLGESTQDDPIYDEVVSLCGDRIGAPFAPDRLTEVQEDAQARIEAKTPPGYLDDDKDGEARFGDVIVWHQLCEQAVLTGKPLVLIADDQKADWIWEERGKALGPRPELVAEMKERAGVGFHLYTPHRFLQVWQERDEGRQIEPQILEEIEDQTDEESGSSSSESLLLRFARDALEKATQTALESRREQVESQPGAHAEVSVWPAHEVRGDSVLLALHLPAERARLRVPVIRVGVTAPDGETTWALVPTLMPQDGVSMWSVSIEYPREVTGTTFLQPGVYTVNWLVQWTRGVPDSTQKESRAADLFTVRKPFTRV